MHALDLNSGEAVWSTKVPGGVVASAASGGDLVYVASFESPVRALNAHTGETRWSSPP